MRGRGGKGLHGVGHNENADGRCVTLQIGLQRGVDGRGSYRICRSQVVPELSEWVVPGPSQRVVPELSQRVVPGPSHAPPPRVVAGPAVVTIRQAVSANTGGEVGPSAERGGVVSVTTGAALCC